MKNRDVKQIDRCLMSINLKEKNGISADKDYIDLYEICRQYGPTLDWEYPRIKELSTFPLKAIEQLVNIINTSIEKNVISEDTYDDIVMLAVVCAHLAADAEIEYDYSDFKWILTHTGKFDEADKIKIVKDAIRLLKENNMSEDKYLSISHALCLVIL